MELLEEEKIDELFEYLEIYRDSLWDEGEIKDAEELTRYYRNNREGLIPYRSQGLSLPEHPEGLEYRNMGTMENHVWSVIARRMKHNHTSWSLRGGNHLSKILAKKCSGKLHEVTEKRERVVYLGGGMDMNRANEARDMTKKLAARYCQVNVGNFFHTDFSDIVMP